MEIKVIPTGNNKAYIEIGPVSMQIFIGDNNKNGTIIFDQLAVFLFEQLGQLSGNYPILKKPWPSIDDNDLTEYTRPIFEIAKRSDDAKITLMAGIAGFMSSLAVEYLGKHNIKKVFVNNGGDIALLLEETDHFNIGIISSVKNKNIDDVVKISGYNGIKGIATSGLGGRSFTLGIADAVTVFSKNAIMADICASVIANKSYVESPRVKTTKAKYLDPNSDIREYDVVTHVEKLNNAEISKAKAQLWEEASKQYELGNIVKMIGYIQGETVIFEK